MRVQTLINQMFVIAAKNVMDAFHSRKFNIGLIILSKYEILFKRVNDKRLCTFTIFFIIIIL